MPFSKWIYIEWVENKCDVIGACLSICSLYIYFCRNCEKRGRLKKKLFSLYVYRIHERRNNVELEKQE